MLAAGKPIRKEQRENSGSEGDRQLRWQIADFSAVSRNVLVRGTKRDTLEV